MKRLTRITILTAFSLLAFACATPGQRKPKNAKSLEQDPRALLRMGDAAAAQNRWSEAEKNYRKSLAIEPDNALAHNRLGLSLMMQEKLDQAIASFARAIEINPDYADAENNLGTAYDRKGDRENAKTRYLKAANSQNYTKSYAAWYNLGKLQFEDRQYDGAITSFREAFLRGPEFQPAGIGLGMALQAAGRLREACAQFDKMVKAFPKSCNAIYSLAACQYDDKRYSDASINFSKVLQTCPGSKEAGKAGEYLKILEGS